MLEYILTVGLMVGVMGVVYRLTFDYIADFAGYIGSYLQSTSFICFIKTGKKAKMGGVTINPLPSYTYSKIICSNVK